MGVVVTLRSGSRITLPSQIRKQLGLAPGDKLILEIEGNRVILRPVGQTVTDYLEGLGSEIWAAEGSAAEFIDFERNAWKDRKNEPTRR